MSIVLGENEVISNFYIDSLNKKSGTTFNFVVSNSQNFINFNKIRRISLSEFNVGFLPFSVNEYNRYFTITDGVNSYQVAIPIGYIDIRTSSSAIFFIGIIQTAMNANPFGWNFTVSNNQRLGTIEWTSSVPIRVSQASQQIFDTFGIRTNANLVSNWNFGGIVTGVYSNVFYICSKQLTRNTIRDCHSNIIINNILGVVSVNSQNTGSDYYHVNKVFEQMKVFDFVPSEPLGNDIDVYLLDCYGNEIFNYPQYETARVNLELKIVSVRNPQFVKTVIEN
jgi:hypothetical protein